MMLIFSKYKWKWDDLFNLLLCFVSASGAPLTFSQNNRDAPTESRPLSAANGTNIPPLPSWNCGSSLIFDDHAPRLHC